MSQTIRGKASKYRGVYKCGRKWKSQIQIDGVQHYLGIFDSEIVAAAKYNEAAAGLGRAENILTDDTLVESQEKKHTESDGESIINLLTTMDTTDEDMPINKQQSFFISKSPAHDEFIEKKIRLGRIIKKISTLLGTIGNEMQMFYSNESNQQDIPGIKMEVLLRNFSSLTTEKMRLKTELLTAEEEEK